LLPSMRSNGSKYAGMLTTLIRAQGVTRIPVDSEGAEAASKVRAELLVPAAELDQTLVVVGSHDNILDVLGNELMGLTRPVRIASSHVGSMGGLTALKNRSALMAGTHLFDELSGDFNFPFFRKYLPGLNVACVNLAIRHQGLIVAKGNPLGISKVEDLARPEVRFINRQRGAGTRILLDYHLRQAGISPEQVNGYDKEEFTHMAVAVNVLTGTASCGLGIFAAASALGLDFVPLARERYDLAFLPEHADWKTEVALELIRSASFKERIEKLVDSGSFVELYALVSGSDAAGVVTGYATIQDRPVYLFAQDFTVHGGAMGKLQALKINKTLELALKTGAPVLALCDSAGVRIDEGAEAMNAYAEIYRNMARLSGVV
ncbi:MAG: hypothetical protein EOM24_34120, partial [Chloroflexia bacterium]|nr:hypothetical protein [Chloroflexia bacterium]